MRVTIGSPEHPGATWDGRGVNFALFSANAEKVDLCLFDPAGKREVARIELPGHTDDMWHGYFPDLSPGQLYGYRVYGEYAPEAGHRFNHHKLLLDPYARQLAGRLIWADAHFGYRLGSQREDLTFDRRDNARAMPKCVVVDDAFTWGTDRPPRVPWTQTIIYEAHVKGLTMRRDDVPAPWRGQYRGLAAPAMIEHLKRLGITSVELLPVHAFVNDRQLLDRGATNYWGYNTISYFAPEPRYALVDPLTEFKSMVARLHDAGIEVILDVVYNHTAEGNHLGPTLSFRGIDNASYYHLVPGAERYYDDFTGCGNSLDLTHPRVLQMVMDSLRYWVTGCHVDGFRFDLATTLARGPTGYDKRAVFLSAVRQDPVLSRIKLIAEPWDIGLGGYQVGNFPGGWSEWNDSYRRSLRRFWRGESGLLGELGGRLSGSPEIFRHDGRPQWTSINHITVHDGFTLADLVSYESKHNDANGEEGRDGSDDNQSGNNGVEGPTDDLQILKLRQTLRCNLISSLLLSQGVPLLLAGDEVGNSQDGNNNTYCQDNEIGWVDWSGQGDALRDISQLVSELTALRRRFPQLGPARWMDGTRRDGSRDVIWLTRDATEMQEDDWHYAEGRFLAYVLTPIDTSSVAVWIMLNASEVAIDVTVPTVYGIDAWKCELTTVKRPAESVEAPCLPGHFHVSPPRSVSIFSATFATGAEVYE